jgi:hypothetical protein
MIGAHLRDFRGCQRAEITCHPMALLGGLNRAGKTSIAQAVGAALCGDALPVQGLPRNSAGLLVRTGASGATVELRGPTGTVTMSWPSGTARSEGQPPTASAYAAGLSSIVTLSPRDRARALSDILHAEPTREELQQALTERGFAPAHVDQIWQWIEESGWDATHTRRKDRGAELKGQWRQVTGVNYGSRIAASWRPDLADGNDSDLSAAVARAKFVLENAQSAAAVSSAERERLTALANSQHAKKTSWLAADTAVKEAGEALRRAQAARMALPPAEQQQTQPCPYCAKPIVVRQVSLVETRLEKAEPIAEGDAKKRRQAIASADGEVAGATDRLNNARRAAALAQAAVNEADAARERIANWPQATETGTDIEAARSELSRAEKRLAEFRMKREADDINARIESNETLLTLLAGDGLRAAKLARVLGIFIGQLRALTDAAGWTDVVEVDIDMAISLSGRPYALLSVSEQYRVRAVLQLATACIEGADLVVIDGADVLDAPTRSGLFAMLDAAGVTALVCMTLSRREQMPDLAASGLGASYWLAGGVVEARQPVAA